MSAKDASKVAEFWVQTLIAAISVLISVLMVNRGR
jgi:hypothetical protein